MLAPVVRLLDCWRRTRPLEGATRATRYVQATRGRLASGQPEAVASAPSVAHAFSSSFSPLVFADADDRAHATCAGAVQAAAATTMDFGVEFRRARRRCR